VLAGLGTLGIGLLMYLNGSALKAFGPYAAMVLFGLAGLYLLLSLRERVTLGRLIVETGVLAAMAAVVYVALPDVFSLRKPLYENAIHETAPAEARAFLGTARAYIANVAKFLETTEVPTAVDAESLIAGIDAQSALVPGFERVPEKDQALMQGAYLRLRSLAPLFASLSDRLRQEEPKGPAVWLPAALAADVRQNLVQSEKDLKAAETDVARREMLIEASSRPAP
jgi:hypothetical protein